MNAYHQLCELINALRAAGVDPFNALLQACAEVFN